ncbi:MAG: hypothetical protein N2C14_21785, partial [Planctomycetales bacterium]
NELQQRDSKLRRFLTTRTRTSIFQAVGPLRLIFCGALVVVLRLSADVDVAMGPVTGLRLDLFNDLLGMLLISAGIYQLSTYEIDGKYRLGMRLLLFASAVGCVVAFLGQFFFSRSSPMSVILYAVGFACLAAPWLFCNCMNQLALAFDLEESGRSWRTTRLTALFGVGATVILHLLVVWVSAATGRQFTMDSFEGMIGMMILLLVPVFNLFVSTSRMKSEANQVHGKSISKSDL